MKIETIKAGLPSRKLSNADFVNLLQEMLGGKMTDAEWKHLKIKTDTLLALTGTESRYVRAEGEKPLDIAVRAAQEALAAASLDPKDVDLLIYTGVARGWLEPAMATVFQAELGLVNATCFDIADACASWMRSLFVAKSFLDGKRYRRILIVNCEMMYWEGFKSLSNSGSFHDVEPWYAGATVGEAATATVVTADDDGKDDFHFGFRTFGEKHDLCKIPLSNYKDFTPDGVQDRHIPMVFSTNSAELIAFTLGKLVEHYKSDDVLQGRQHDILIAHQVAARISGEVARRFGLPPEIAYETHSLYGNTVSATMPLALATADQEGRLVRGTRVLLAMGSSGVTSGLCSFTY